MTPIDIAVVGCGMMGRNHAHAASDHPCVNLAAVVDIDADTAGDVADRYGADAATTDHEVGIESADAVVIATPEFAHADQAAAAMERGRHVLLEKPLTVDTDRARELAETADDGEMVSGVSFVLRYDPGYATARDTVRSGGVGDPVAVRASRGITTQESRRIGRRGHPLYYMNIHDIDAMCWCVEQDVTTVEAIERRGELNDVDVPDAVHATLSFEDGTIGSLSGYGTLPAGTPGGITADFEIVGSDGTVSVDTPGDTVEITDADGSDRPDTRHWPVVNGRMDGAVRRQMDTFVRAIRDDGELLASLRDGVRAQEIADALREALDSDGAVQVDRHR